MEVKPMCHLCGQQDDLSRLEEAIGVEYRPYRRLCVLVHYKCFQAKQAGRRDRYLALNGPLPWPEMR
jgi:hypothetical protein